MAFLFTFVDDHITSFQGSDDLKSLEFSTAIKHPAVCGPAAGSGDRQWRMQVF
jgi:hypothetical protein